LRDARDAPSHRDETPQGQTPATLTTSRLRQSVDGGAGHTGLRLGGSVRDESGFRAFVQGGSSRHLRTAYLLTGNAADAEDLLQTALAKLVRVWDRVAQSGDVDAYLRRVLVNAHVSRGRRLWHRERPTDAPPDLPGRDPYVTLDERDQLRRALTALSPGERRAVVLRHVEDLPEAEVARLLGCSVGTVKSQSARGLAKLRRSLEGAADPLSAPLHQMEARPMEVRS
jgi:RNA polymerase sigma-70 factor (sigma-E family)